MNLGCRKWGSGQIALQLRQFGNGAVAAESGGVYCCVNASFAGPCVAGMFSEWALVFQAIPGDGT
jgi:hypothetical protein